jgi:hypothetical protein
MRRASSEVSTHIFPFKTVSEKLDKVWYCYIFLVHKDKVVLGAWHHEIKVYIRDIGSEEGLRIILKAIATRYPQKHG